MEIGTGIFFGLLFIGLVWLYVSTRDRWRWKRFFAWCAAIIATLSLGLGGWAGYDHYQRSRPRFQDSLWGLRPGMTPEDVVFRKGEPTTKNDRTWIYYDKDSRVANLVLWKNGKAQAIETHITTGGQTYSLPSIPGVSTYDSLEEIEEKLGTPDAVSHSEDSAQRIVNYLRFGLFLTLEKNKLVAVGVLDPKLGPIRFIEEAKKGKE